MGIIVIACYKPKPGKKEKLDLLVKQHLKILLSQDLVTDRESIMMEAKDGSIIEVFEWKSKEAIEKAHNNQEVNKMWQEYSEVCDYIPIGELAESADMFAHFTPFN